MAGGWSEKRKININNTECVIWIIYSEYQLSLIMAAEGFRPQRKTTKWLAHHGN